MQSQNANNDNLAAREILTVREFNFPRDLLFKAWEDPALLANWWGPNGFTNTFHTFDFKPGGNWEFVMHGPDGTNYDNKSIFIEIIKPARIVFQHLEPMHRFEVTASFEELGNNSRLSFCMRFDSVAECDKVKNYVIEANEQNFDRLEAVLSKMTNKP